MTENKTEAQVKKKAIFDSMSPKYQKRILKKGFDKWDPFQEPNDPVDIRKDKTKRTTQELVREFLQTRGSDAYSNAYGQGVFDLCLGLINDDERYKGMFDFSCWYRELLKRESGTG